MAYPQALSCTTNSMLRGALLPRSSLIHTQIRYLFTLTAFEKAKQELYGDRWRENLNRSQWKYVQFKDRARKKRALVLQEALGDKWEAAVAKETAERYASRDFQDKVRQMKQKLSAEEQEGKAA